VSLEVKGRGSIEKEALGEQSLRRIKP